jgi:hypothetical protein
LILGLYINSVGVAIVSSYFIYCVYCNPSSAFLIYTHIFQTGFPRGGFIQGHVDQKYLCLQMHVLVSYICLFSAVNDVLGVLCLFEMHVLILCDKNDMLKHPN